MAPDPDRWEESYDAPPAPPQYVDGTPTGDPEDTGGGDPEDTAEPAPEEVVAGYAPAPVAPIAPADAAAEALTVASGATWSAIFVPFRQEAVMGVLSIVGAPPLVSVDSKVGGGGVSCFLL